MKQISFSFVIIVLLIISLLLLITSSNKDPYINNINKIFKLYDYCLVELSKKLDTKNKKIIKAKYFDDLVNAKFGEKKPIFYIMTDKVCEFYVNNKNEIYTFILKK